MLRHLQPELACCFLSGQKIIFRIFIVLIVKDMHPAEIGDKGLQNLQTFLTNLRSKSCDASHVPLRALQVLEKTQCHRVRRMAKHDGDFLGRCLGCSGRARAGGEDHVDFVIHKVACPRLQCTAVSLDIAQLDHEILSFDVSQISQPLFETLDRLRFRRTGFRDENADANHSRGFPSFDYRRMQGVEAHG